MSFHIREKILNPLTLRLVYVDGAAGKLALKDREEKEKEAARRTDAVKIQEACSTPPSKTQGHSSFPADLICVVCKYNISYPPYTTCIQCSACLTNIFKR